LSTLYGFYSLYYVDRDIIINGEEKELAAGGGLRAL